MKNFWPIVALILVGIIFFLRVCTPKPSGGSVVKIDTVFIKVTDTIVKEKLVPVEKIVNHTPAPVDHWDTVFLTDIQVVDTAAILKDYFATRYYSDTNHLETYGNFIINDAITQNKVKSRQIIYNLKFPQITKTIIEPKRKGYLGLNLGIGNQFAMGGMQFTYVDRKDNMFHLGADYTTGNFFLFSVGTSWKISLFK